MTISELLNYIQENLNDGYLSPDSEACIMNNWGDVYPVTYVRNYENELLLADYKPT